MITFTIPIGSYDLINHNIFESVVKHVLTALMVDSDNLILKSRNSEEDNIDVTLDNRRGIEQKNIITHASYTVSQRDPGNSTFRLRSNYNTPILGEKSNFFIVPVNIGSKMSVSLQIKTNSSEEANKILNRVKLQTRTYGTTQFHNVLYRYYLPKRVEDLLYAIFNIRKDVIGDVDTFIDFINIVKMKDITLMSNNAGEDLQIGIRDKQMECLGGFEDNQFDAKPTYDKESGKYICDLVYNLYYDIPTYITVSYFISIYNKLLPDNFIIRNTTINGYSGARVNVLSTYFDITASSTNISKDVDYNNPTIGKYIHIPKEDVYTDFTDNIGITIFSALTLVDKSNLLFNLNELGDVSLDPILLLYLKEWGHEYACTDFMDIVNLSLYENNSRISNALELDKNLNVYTNIALDAKKRYRVLLSLTIDMSCLSNNAVNRYKEFLNYIESEYGIGNETISEIEIPRSLTPITVTDWNNVQTAYKNVLLNLESWESFIKYLMDRDFGNSASTMLDAQPINDTDKSGISKLIKNASKLTAIDVNKFINYTISSNRPEYNVFSFIINVEDDSKLYVRCKNNSVGYIIRCNNSPITSSPCGEIFFKDGRKIIRTSPNTYEVILNNGKKIEYNNLERCFISTTNALLAINEYIDRQDGAIMKTVMSSLLVGTTISNKG